VLIKEPIRDRDQTAHGHQRSANAGAPQRQQPRHHGISAAGSASTVISVRFNHHVSSKIALGRTT
jgi:hypothetical protein